MSTLWLYHYYIKQTLADYNQMKFTDLNYIWIYNIKFPDPGNYVISTKFITFLYKSTLKLYIISNVFNKKKLS